MKQTQKTRRHRGLAGGRHEPLPADPRDPDIVHAHRIALRSSRPGTGRAGPKHPRRAGPGAVTGHDRLAGPAGDAGKGTG
jgi:hypothetical protein